MVDLAEFYGPNAGYVLELYERYQRDPQTVDEHTRALFDGWSPADLIPVTAGLSAPSNGDVEMASSGRRGAASAEALAGNALTSLPSRPGSVTGTPPSPQDLARRSEERRVGKEGECNV